MKETGIIMSGDHPKLILDLKKTMTRRAIKLKNYSREIWDKCVPHNGGKAMLLGEPYLRVPYDPVVDNAGNRITCPYGQVGDRLWVRETWAIIKENDNVPIYEMSQNSGLYFKADNPNSTRIGKWRPSIFMPRWASRITLEITEVRVERLQEITEKDALDEGIEPFVYSLTKLDLLPTQKFQRLWDSLNAKRGYGWETNPWVWVISFRLLK